MERRVSAVEREDPAVGDERLHELYRRNVDAVFGYVARRVGRDLAADLTAETFRIAVEQVDRFDPRRGVERAWLFGIATNLLRRHWRTEARRLRALSRQGAQRAVPGDPLMRVDERLDAESATALVIAAAAKLAPEDRDLLVLVAWEGWRYRDVAEALDIPIGTVRSRLNRIRGELRAELEHAKERHLEDG